MTREAAGQAQPATGRTGGDDRARLLATLPVSEHKMELAGIRTSVLVGGDGPPMVLLHGPGEPAVWWMRVVPDLVKTHRVVAPDLPGHGASGLPDGRLDAGRLLAWLDALIERTCEDAPVLVGHALGGAIAARFAVERGDRLAQLVLVDSLGLARFLPAPRFAFELVRFMAKPTETRHGPFLSQCMLDPTGLRRGMGGLWEPFLAYYLQGIRTPATRQAMQTLMKTVGMPRIPAEDLARIRVPAALIWGRHDKAVRLKVAEAASARHGWPLHVIEDARDDPKLERPAAFLRALRLALDVDRRDSVDSSALTAPAQRSYS